MMNIPSFSGGERLSAAKLNALADAIRELQREAAASRITSVNGGTFSRTAGGTTLDIRRVVPAAAPAAAAPSFDHPFKVSLIPPAEKGGKYRVKVQLGSVFFPHQYSITNTRFIPAFMPASPSYIGGNMAELPDGAHTLYVVVGWVKSGAAFDTYEQDVGDEEDVVFRGKVNGWTLQGSGLFFNTDDNLSASVINAERTQSFVVASFSRTKTADGAETVSMTQSLFHHIYLPFWTPDVAHIQQGWL